MKKSFYSQEGQDRFIFNCFFRNVASGYFVDIGANDGVTYSNSKLFEDQGWDGVCVEPIPEVFNKLVSIRNCKCINGVVSDVAGKVEFLHVKGYSEMLSGIQDKYDNRHLERINKEIEEYGGATEKISVDSYSFEEIAQNTRIDYLTIDVEGGELEILKNIDFNKFDVKVISIENNYLNKDIHRILKDAGFKLITRIGGDEIYSRIPKIKYSIFKLPFLFNYRQWKDYLTFS